jgi:hypothetical protein
MLRQGLRGFQVRESLMLPSAADLASTANRCIHRMGAGDGIDGVVDAFDQKAGANGVSRCRRRARQAVPDAHDAVQHGFRRFLPFSAQRDREYHPYNQV